MNPALLFLFRRSFVNGVRSYFARLRQVKYLVPTLLGVLYFLLIFAGPGGNGPRPPDTEISDRAFAQAALWIPWAVGTGVLLLAVSSWLLPSTKPGLMFKEAEVANLFPAPITRREIVTYKVLQLQAPLAFTLLLLLLFMGRSLGFPRALYAGLGAWLALNIVSLHQIGVRMTHMSLARHGLPGLRRQGPILVAVAAFLGVLLWTLPPFPELGGSFPEIRDALGAWCEASTRSPAATLLYPFRLVGMIPLSDDPLVFLGRFAQGLVVAALLFLWVVRTDAAFEEAAAAQAEETARVVAAVREGRFGALGKRKDRARKAPWRLRSPGPPETAFVWKGAVGLVRTFSPALLFAFLPMILAGTFLLDRFLREQSGRPFPLFSGLMAGIAMMITMAGTVIPMFTLRAELQNVEALKTLPVPAPRLVRSMLAGLVVPFAALQVLLLLLGVLALPESPKFDFTLAWKASAFLAGAVLLPCLTAASFAVDSVAPILFPGWLKPGEVHRGGGVENMGQGILIMLMKLLGMGAGAIVPGILGFGGGALGFAFLPPAFRPAVVIAASLLASAALLAEVHLLTLFLGNRFERLDPAAEGMIS